MKKKKSKKKFKKSRPYNWRYLRNNRIGQWSIGPQAAENHLLVEKHTSSHHCYSDTCLQLKINKDANSFEEYIKRDLYLYV